MIQWAQLNEWQQDWLKVDEVALKKRLDFLRRAPSRDQMLFINSLKEVKQGRRELLKENAEVFSNQLALDSSIASTPNLDRLLELGVRHREGGTPDRRRWFESLSLFDQALAIARIEYKDPLESVGRDLESLLDYLWKTFFDDEYMRLHLHAYHDPENDFVVAKEDVSTGNLLTRPGKIHYMYPLDCRSIKNGGIAFMDDRIKSAFSVWLKIGRKMQAGEVTETYTVNDRRGLLFAVPTYEDLEQFAFFLLGTLLQDGAEELEKLSMTSKDKPADPNNPHSSPLYRVAKMLVRWRESEYEFQFITFHDYITSRRALTAANHALYKQKQAFNFAFPFLWPKEIYHIDWSQERLRQDLRVWKVDQLGWHVNGKISKENA